MQEQYKHLRITKEQRNNNRRTQTIRLPRRDLGDLRAHGQRLLDSLDRTAGIALSQEGASTDGFVLKLTYNGALDFSHLDRHGVEFISQEEKQMCVVFSNEQGLALFSDHLQKLGLDGAELTYRQILEALDGIDNWSSEDRMSNAIQFLGFPDDDTFLLDVELWPIRVAGHPERRNLIQTFEAWLTQNDIGQVDRVNHDSLLLYRVQVGQEQASALLNHKDVRYVDLTPQSGISYQKLDITLEQLPETITPPPMTAAKVCILDSGISTNNPLLAPAVGEAQSFISDANSFDGNGHGTAVAGIALYGDVEQCAESNFWSPQLWVLSGKVLDDNAEYDVKTIESSLTEAVEYFTDQGCKIFNLSLGNIHAPYDGSHIRGIAYVLDTLSRQYGVLFIVSAGNFAGSEDPQVPQDSWREEYPDYLLHDASCLIDPAPALNTLTVGSLARHDATLVEQKYPEANELAPARNGQPSPFTRHGPSVRGAFKPDLVAVGGNLACPIREDGRQWRAMQRGLGVVSLNNHFVGNTLLTEMAGTSFAAPYITHLAGRFLNEYPDASANLIRAMLVSHARVTPEIEQTFGDDARELYKQQESTKGREIDRDVVGYGEVQEDLLYRSTESQVLLMAEDEIENDRHQFFELPLPEDFLRRNRATREITVTLSHTPDVRTTRSDYVATRLSYRLVKGSSLDQIQQHFNRETQDQFQRQSDAATPNRDVGQSQREKGTVQSSTWRMKQLKPDEKWFVVVTRQDRDWSPVKHLEEPYALVVSVSDRENQDARLYSQIQQRLQAREQLRART